MALEIPNDIGGGGIDSKHFIKLKDGESVTCVLQGKMRILRKHWKNKQPILCTGKAVCPECQAGDKPKFTFQLNAIVKESSGYVCKILEQGFMMFENVRALNNEIDLEKTPIKIVRKGAGIDTIYTIIPLAQLDAAKEEAVKSVELFDLENLDAPVNEPKASENGASFEEDTIPF
jgi:hypothetical protein